MSRNDETPDPTFGADRAARGELGADIRDLYVLDGLKRERAARRILHPAIPSLERLKAFRRPLARIGNNRRQSPQTDGHPPEGNPLSFALCVHQFVEDAYLAVDDVPSLDADISLRRLLFRLDESEIPFWKAYVIKKARKGSCRGMASLLDENYALADELGFDPTDPPSHTTLSRHWRYDDDMETAVDELALRARYAGLWTGADFP